MCLLSSCPETEWNDDSRPWEPANKMEASGVREHSRGGNGGVGGSDPGEQSPELAQILTTKLSSLNLQMPGLSAVAMKGDEKVCTATRSLLWSRASELVLQADVGEW